VATLAEIKRAVQPGQVYDVTNHYITRTSHPCYGTRRDTITAVTGSSFRWASTQWATKWPRASQVQMDADGTIRLYGGGAGQKPDELFLTLTPVAAAAPVSWACEDCDWPWPLPGCPPEGAECDACGGQLVPVTASGKPQLS
jgi:hypothetical protein